MDTYVSSWTNLLNDAMKWLLILIPLSTALAVAYFSLIKQWSDGDSGVVSTANRRMKTALIFGSIGMAASGIVKGFLAYFK